jgi:hypothetical protein
MQVDQGLGLGTHNAFFNKHTLSVTRFLRLRDPAFGSSAPPWVLVLHGRCVLVNRPLRCPPPLQCLSIMHTLAADFVQHMHGRAHNRSA